MKRRDLLNAQKLRAMSTGELHSTMDQKYLEMMNLRFQTVTGRLKDTNRLSQVRHEIARIKTILREREILAQYEEQSQ